MSCRFSNELFALENQASNNIESGNNLFMNIMQISSIFHAIRLFIQCTLFLTTNNKINLHCFEISHTKEGYTISKISFTLYCQDESVETCRVTWLLPGIVQAPQTSLFRVIKLCICDQFLTQANMF